MKGRKGAKYDKRYKDIVTKSWFVTFDHPADHGYPGTPEEVCLRLCEEWIAESDTRTGAWAYCVSAAGLHHVHMVLEDKKSMRFSKIIGAYAAGSHFEATRGTKEDALAYIRKEGKYAEKGEEVLYTKQHGEIQGAQGERTDLEKIEALLDEGKTPAEIYEISFSYRRYDKLIRDEYIKRQYDQTPQFRTVRVHYLVGESGTGKSYTYARLCKKYGEDAVCLVTDYSIGGLDHYIGEKILFLDEYKGELPYGMLLTICDKYKANIHARYRNIWALWDEVYIASIYPPEELYEIMVAKQYRTRDTHKQFLRRIHDITYFYMKKGRHCHLKIRGNEYESYAALKHIAEEKAKGKVRG